MTTDTLAFAHQLARFESHLEALRYRAADSIGFGYAQDFGAEAAALAEWCTVLLDRVAEGETFDSALGEAMTAWGAVNAETAGIEQAHRTRRTRELAQREIDEEISRKVECPFCGSAPGEVCRTVGRWHSSRQDSHRDRYRLARSLNDGRQPDEAAP